MTDLRHLQGVAAQAEASRHAQDAARAAAAPDPAERRRQAYKAAEAARLEKQAQMATWHEYRAQIKQAAERARSERHHAIHDHDVEVALEADRRSRALGLLLAAVDDEFRRTFPHYNLAQMERV